MGESRGLVAGVGVMRVNVRCGRVLGWNPMVQREVRKLSLY